MSVRRLVFNLSTAAVVSVLIGCAANGEPRSEVLIYCNDVQHRYDWQCAGGGGGRGKPPA